MAYILKSHFCEFYLPKSTPEQSCSDLGPSIKSYRYKIKLIEKTRFGAIFVKKMSHHSVRLCETSPISCLPAFTEQIYFAHQSQENAYLRISKM